MNNISFKAQLKGINDWKKQLEFELKTVEDSNDYKLTYLYKDPVTDWDIFQLSHKNEEIVKYANIQNSKKSPKEYNIDELFKIYRILRIKGALKIVERLKQEKKDLKYDKYMEEIDKKRVITQCSYN